MFDWDTQGSGNAMKPKAEKRDRPVKGLCEISMNFFREKFSIFRSFFFFFFFFAQSSIDMIASIFPLFACYYFSPLFLFFSDDQRVQRSRKKKNRQFWDLEHYFTLDPVNTFKAEVESRKKHGVGVVCANDVRLRFFLHTLSLVIVVKNTFDNIFLRWKNYLWHLFRITVGKPGNLK